MQDQLLCLKLAVLDQEPSQARVVLNVHDFGADLNNLVFYFHHRVVFKTPAVSYCVLLFSSVHRLHQSQHTLGNQFVLIDFLFLFVEV